MECPNCPNDETFFRRDGVGSSHLCGICGAAITVKNQQEADEKLPIDQNSANPESQSCENSAITEPLNQDEQHERQEYLAKCYSVEDTHVSRPTNDRLLEKSRFEDSGSHSGLCSDEEQRLIDNAELPTSDSDYKLLQKKHLALWDDFRGLEVTLEELMIAYEAQIEVTQKLQSDYRASDELRELEINRLRASLRDEQCRIDSLEAERAELSSVCCQLKSDLASVKVESERYQAEYQKAEEKFNQLKQQAERKLKLAEEKVLVTISSYTSLQESYSSLENEFSLLSARHASYSSELKQKESQCTELTCKIQSLLDLLKEKDQEIANSSIAFTSAQHEVQITKQKLHDLQEMNCRFKAGLVRANEDNRSLKEKLARLEVLEKENLEQSSRLDSLLTENSNLKSRIFDAMEVEKALRRELCSSNTAQPEDSSILEELEFLRKDLQEKTIENKELLQISEELLEKLSHVNIQLERDL